MYNKGWHKIDEYFGEWVYFTEDNLYIGEWAIKLILKRCEVIVDYIYIPEGTTDRLNLKDIFKNPLQPTDEELVLFTLEYPWLELLANKYKDIVEDYLNN